MSISTHILNTSTGRPAVHVPVELDFLRDGEWVTMNATHTDSDGRVKHLLPADEAMQPGIYCARFATGIYYERENVKGLYPYVEITFLVLPEQNHYHIPLLLTPNSYTTYRGT